MHRVPVIDLFAGAGGFGVAAQSSGGDLRLSVELDPAACNTLRANADEGHKVLEADVTTLTGQGLREEARLAPSDELVIVGGAPCQPFSKASYWRDPGHEADYRRAKAAGEDVRKPPQIAAAKEDERRDLVQEFARLVIETKASGFVFENVPSILHRRNRELVASFIGRLAEAGHYPAIDIEASISRAMTALISEQHYARVRTFKQLLSSFQRNRDLVSVGAYAKGSDPMLDKAIALWPQLEGYLQQGIFERADWEASLQGLERIFPTVS